MSDKWKKELSSIKDVDIAWNEPLSKHTTLRVGGKISCIVYPLSKTAAISVIRVLGKNKIPYFVIGKGSNLLVAENLPEMAAINVEKGAIKLETVDRKKDLLLKAGAGVSIPGLMRFCLKKQLGGLEFLAGIPGTIGGAAAMNAGTQHGEISDVLESATVVTEEGERKIGKDRIRFSYRNSSLPEEGVIWDVTLRTKKCNRGTLRKRMIEILRQRKAKQPEVKGTAGSVFKNPPNDFAGRLIEKAGLKGRVLGGAKISEKHANWIVTTRDAKADDVYGLLKLVQKEVERKYGTRLEPEIRIIGFD